ncbi:DUF1173 family protein, partial [Mesorhizobium tamadayense]|uniref:DUF1173 family protein n=1 Tax=Mesorhizobium tamadayense TaxID=425306 RepID=UPI001FE17476
LSEILFVLEPFRSAEKFAIEQRRGQALAPALPPKSGPRKLMILVGEVKEFSPARSGHKLIVKHNARVRVLLGREPLLVMWST